MVGIYADEAITETKTVKRDGFLKMINDCMAGMVDVILTKSISRFSRNLVDTLQYVRMLKDKGIAVIFEMKAGWKIWEEEQYYIKEYHEPIVSAEIWEAAQEIKKSRYCGVPCLVQGQRRSTAENMLSVACVSAVFVGNI